MTKTETQIKDQESQIMFFALGHLGAVGKMCEASDPSAFRKCEI